MARKTGITISKDEILDAALVQFAQAGFDGTKVGDIAKEAGITAGAIYIHFKSKEELFQTLLTREFAKASIIPPDQDLSLRDSLIHVGTELIQIFQRDRAFTRVVFLEGIKNPAIAIPFYQQLLRQTAILEELLMKHYNIAQTDSLSAMNIASRFFLGAIGWAEMALDVFHGRELEPVDDREMVEFYTDLFLKGLDDLGKSMQKRV